MPEKYFYNPTDMGTLVAKPCDENNTHPSASSPVSVVCNNNCFLTRYGIVNAFSKDGICDDGVGQNWGPCPIGTDCEDCVERLV